MSQSANRSRLHPVAALGIFAALAFSAPVIADPVRVVYYYTDPQGSVLEKVDANGNPLDIAEYLPFGNGANGATMAGPAYAGHVSDVESELIYMQARYYDSDTARFVSADPDSLEAANVSGFNRYSYANLNPYLFVDADGRRAVYGDDGFSPGSWVERAEQQSCRYCVASEGAGTQGGGAQQSAATSLKAVFVYAHLSDATAAAGESGIAPAAILGVAGLESGWGQSRFAREGNNYFGLHAPALYQVGSMAVTSGNVKMAMFSSFYDSARAFVDKNQYLRGATDPMKFATSLQDKGRFGIDLTTGKPLPGYPGSVARTINSVQAIIDSQK